MTKEEVEDNYEFKVSKRILKHRFPWIADISVQGEDLNRYNLIFINIYVDLLKFMEAYRVTPPTWVTQYLKSGQPYNAIWVTMLSKDKNENLRHVEDEVNNLLSNIHKSPAFPNNLRLPKNRKLQKGDIIIDPKHNQEFIDMVKNFPTSWTQAAKELSTKSTQEGGDLSTDK